MSALTKIFIVLQLVCSLAVAVLLVLMVQKQDNYRKQYENEYTRSLAYQATAGKQAVDLSAKDSDFTALSNKYKSEQDAANKAATAATIANTDLKTQLALAQDQVSQLQNKNTTLTTTNAQQASQITFDSKRLAELIPEVGDYTTKNAQLNRANLDLTASLEAAKEAIRKLEEVVAQYEAAPKGGAAGNTGGGTATVSLSAQTNVQINGKISKMTLAQGRTLIELPLGTRDGVAVKTRFAIYRDSSYIGDAEVERVSPDQAVAVVTLTKPGQAVQVGDMVMSGIGQ